MSALSKEKEFAQELLSDFKERMHITHSSEDDTLKRMLESSAVAIAKLVGASSFDGSLAELTMERALYVYNDALDEFRKAYADEIEDLYLSNLIMASEEKKHASQ